MEDFSALTDAERTLFEALERRGVRFIGHARAQPGAVVSRGASRGAGGSPALRTSGWLAPGTVARAAHWWSRGDRGGERLLSHRELASTTRGWRTDLLAHLLAEGLRAAAVARFVFDDLADQACFGRVTAGRARLNLLGEPSAFEGRRPGLLGRGRCLLRGSMVRGFGLGDVAEDALGLGTASRAAAAGTAFLTAAECVRDAAVATTDSAGFVAQGGTIPDSLAARRVLAARCVICATAPA